MKEPKLTPRFENYRVLCSWIVPYQEKIDLSTPKSLSPYLSYHQPLGDHKIEWEDDYGLIFESSRLCIELRESIQSFNARKRQHQFDLQKYEDWKLKNADKLAAKARKTEELRKNRERLKELKQSAKSKLTLEEQKALGLK